MGRKDLTFPLLLLVCCEVWICSSEKGKTVGVPSVEAKEHPPILGKEKGEDISETLSKLLEEDGKLTQKQIREAKQMCGISRFDFPTAGGKSLEREEEERYYYGHGGYGHGGYGHGHGYYHRPYYHHHHRPYHHNHYHAGHYHNGGYGGHYGR